MSGSKKRRFFLFSFAARLLMLVAAAALILSYLSPYINPEKLWQANCFGLAFVPLFLLNLFLLVWAIVRRSSAFAIPLVALLPSVFFVGLFWQWNDVGPDRKPDSSIRIASYNVGTFGMAKAKLKNSACADSVFNFLKSTDADIICLQEFQMDKNKDVGEYLAKKMPSFFSDYYVYSSTTTVKGNVILSRYPFVRKGKLEFENSKNLAIYGDFDVNGKRLRVYNCHFQSYAMSLTHIASTLRKDSEEALRYTGSKMKTSLQQRPVQVEQVLSHIADSDASVIVAGDFNDTPMSYTYRRMSRGRLDTFVAAGRGMEYTYSALRPFLRIDYIFVPESGNVTGHRIARKRLSDHYPVIADLEI